VQAQTAKNTGYRTFLDARGRLWEVWMVHPSSIERRGMERRCISSLQLGDESATESPVPLRGTTPDANGEDSMTLVGYT